MKTKQLMTVLLILGIFSLLPGSSVDAERDMRYRYVVPGGSTSSTDCIRSEPCDLRYAIDVVADPGDILIVHSGTYTSSLPSEELIFIDKTLTLWGSCEFDDSTPFICYPKLHSSNLDGETAKRVIRIDGVLGTEEVVIQGFTIMRGTGTGMVPCYFGMDGCGGGVYAIDLERLKLENNYIWQNTGGYTSGFGGGLYVENINLLEVEQNTFIFNQATETGTGAGGAGFVYASGGPHAVIFEKNLIYGNETSSDDFTGSSGAGLVVFLSNNAQIENNTFTYQNTIQNNMNAIGTSIFIASTTGFSIQDNTFQNDWGPSVVGIMGDCSSGNTISRNKWWNNMVFYNIEMNGDIGVDIVNNFFGRQILGTLSRGGASTLVYLEGDSITERVDANIQFNTFAAANYGVDVGDYADVNIYANIFTEMTDAILSSGSSSSFTIDNNLFYNNTSYSTVGTHPIYENPMLVNVASGDFHLLPGSGAIDKASALDFDIDIDGGHRPIGLGATPYDVGADEFAWPFYLPLFMK